MPRPTVVEIDLAAIPHNLKALRSLLDPDVDCFGIVKADGYGHGAVPVGRVLAGEGIRRFAVATVDEGVELLDAGTPGTVLILGVPDAGEIPELVGRGLDAVVSGLTVAQRLDAEARRRDSRVDVHLKFDTGMGRIGIPPEKATETALAVAAMPGLRIAGAMTHFPSADDPSEDAFTREQVATLARIRDDLSSKGLKVPVWHAANSAGVIYFPESHFGAVRPGISMYGVYPSAQMPMPESLALRQAMTLKTCIAQVREAPCGRTLSYGRTYRTARSSRIAVLPLGYADGFSRRNSNCASVLIRGARAPVVGRVCMDLTLVDVTDLPDARPGDEVVVYGRQGDDMISILDVAERLDTAPQVVVMAGLSRRVRRVYRNAKT